MQTAKDETIAWALWHIARVYDLTINILVSCADQVKHDSLRLMRKPLLRRLDGEAYSHVFPSIIG